MIHLYHTRFDRPFSEAEKARYLPMLSAEQRAAANRFYHWEDTHRSILGRLLIRHALLAAGQLSTALFDLHTSPNGRPFHRGPLDFNISHSGNYVVCAASTRCRVGIDIEEIKAVDLNDFASTMTPRQWKEIRAAEPHREFFRHWAIKESVIKADGIGLSKALDALEMEEDKILLNGVSWNFRLLDINPGYACAVACNQANMLLELKELKFQED